MRFPFLNGLLFSLIVGSISLCFLPEFLLLKGDIVLYVLISTFLLCLLAWAFKRSGWLKCGMFLLIFVGIVGYQHSQALDALKNARNLAALPKKIQTTFHIEEILQQQDYQAAVIRAKLAENLAEMRLYARLSLKEQVKLGEVWQGELAIRPISSRLNVGGFDRQQWYFAKHIAGYATIKSAVKIGEDFSWRERLFYQAKEQTAELNQQGLLLALGFGERAWLPSADWQIYQQTNTAHLIAISGLHIGLAMLIGFGLARMLQFWLPLKWISPYFPLILGTVFALFYAQLAGFAIPTLRAAIALFVVFILRVYRYYFTPWRSFFLVVGLLLFSDPLMILSSSFVLSVGAVGSLILWYQLFPLSYFAFVQKQSLKFVKWLISLIHLQIGLLWLFMPIQLAIFDGFSLYGFLANLIAVPVFSFILVPLVLFAILTQGSVWSWEMADWLAQKILVFLSYLDSGWLNLSLKTQGILTTLFALLLLWRLYFKRKTTTYPKGLYCLAIGVCGFGLFNIFPIKNEQWRIETLDIGQGLATLMVKNGRGILYDTGAAWQNGSMAELEILPYLRREEIALDKLILSHDDNDHSGGAKAILNAFPQVEFISPSFKNYGKTDRTFCVKGLNFQWQGINFNVLSPKEAVNDAKNPDSCVMLVSDGRYNLLLTGDADTATEQKILPELEKIHILQVGHHGSKTSTSTALLQKTKPDIALISSGRWNPWHFPHNVVTERLKQAKSAVYNTAVSGQISVVINKDEIRIETARNTWSPWYRQLIIP